MNTRIEQFQDMTLNAPALVICRSLSTPPLNRRVEAANLVPGISKLDQDFADYIQQQLDSANASHAIDIHALSFVPTIYAFPFTFITSLFDHRSTIESAGLAALATTGAIFARPAVEEAMRLIIDPINDLVHRRDIRRFVACETGQNV